VLPVEVSRLDPVKINKNKVSDPGPGQKHGDIAANPPATGDANPGNLQPVSKPGRVVAENLFVPVQNAPSVHSRTIL
jgi:hypothetical protein